MRRFGFIALAAMCSLSACDRAGNEPATAQTVAAGPVAAAATPACAEFPKNPDAGEGTRPVKVPRQFASFVKASDTTLTVQRTSGPPACIDIGGIDVDSFDTFLDGRLFGATLFGHEYNSYLLVDRNSTAAPVETGVKPVFSPSGRRFASVDISEAGFGAFEALGVWEMIDGSIRNLVKLEDILDRGYDWQLVRWASDDCLVFSTAADPTGVDLDERKFHELRLTDRPALKDVDEAAVCR
jgi:hypothetical protein